MSIKPYLSLRGLAAGLIAAAAITVAGFALERQHLTTAFSPLAAIAGPAAPVGPRPQNAPEPTPEASTDVPARPASEPRIIVGQGNGASYLSPSRIDKVQVLQPSGTPQVISQIEDFEPQWSPDGKKVVFVSLRDAAPNTNYYNRHPDRALYVMNADGTDQRRIFTPNSTGVMQPTFSPDGTKIAFLNDGDQLMTVNVFGSSDTPVDISDCFVPAAERSRRPSADARMIPGIYGAHSPDYSPDGSQLIYVQWDSTLEVYAIFRVPTNGSGGCSLVYASNDDVTPISPQYSPDGTKIALYRVEGSSDPATATRKLRIIDAATGATIADHEPPNFFGEPVWSPDGTKIAYPLGQYDAVAGQEIRGLGVLTYELATGVVEDVDLSGLYEGINGLHWGVPSMVVPTLSMRINSPHPLSSGQSTTAAVYLADPAPPGGTVITLSPLGAVGAITVPANIVIPEGQTSANFTINSAASTLYRTAGVLATRNSPSLAQAEASVSLHPARPDLVATQFTVPSTAVPGVSFSTTRTVQNIGLVSTSSGYTDGIYLSTDNVLDASDGSALLTSSQTALAAGATRGPTATNVTIPAGRISASGLYYLIFKTNHLQVLNEGSSYANNTIAQPIQVNTPDVVIENLSVPAQVEPGLDYTVNFTIRNQGNAATPVSFTTRTFYSQDNVAGNGDDVSAAVTLTTAAGLAAGASTATQSRTVNIPTTPQRDNGPGFFYVQVDSGGTIAEGTASGELNNNTFAPTTFTYRVPDLQVTASSLAADIDTDTSFPFSWTTANLGDRGTTANLLDRVYLSTDAQVSANDAQIGSSFTLTGGLGAGASVNRIQNFTIATSSIPASGTYYLYVVTDASGIVNEGVFEGNNTRFQPVFIRRAFRPDLVVTNVTAPPTAFFDQTIQVQWTVRNNGAGPTNAPQWKDYVYIGTSPTSTSGATKLAEVSSVSALGPGESATASAIVKVPRGFNGQYYFLVRTNANAAVNEESTANNLLAATVSQISVPPLPDLTVETVQAPDEVFAGQALLINYTVRNLGTADASSRRDRIYLSRDTVLNTGQDRLVFTSDEFFGPAAGQTTSHVSQNRVGSQVPAQYTPAYVPGDLEGLWYVIVVTDYQNGVYEYSNENNNTNYDAAEPGSPMNILVTPPDLVVPAPPTAPATAASGTSFPVTFTVRNQGAFAADPNLYHGVYLSADATFTPATDTLVGLVRDPAAFTPGAEHLFTTNVSLPSCLANGTYYLFAVADHNGRQFEFDANFDAEANNASAARSVQLSTTPPDLQVTAAQLATTPLPGQSVTVNWTVSNTGGSASGNWIDRIHLRSTDPQVAAVTLGSFERTGGLAAGGSYAMSRAVALPPFMEGGYFISVTTDAASAIAECGTSEANNFANTTTFTVSNNLPDLVIDTVSAPAAAILGDPFTVQWTGRNANQGMAGNTPSWRDNVYLSTNTTLSNNDHYVGSALNSTPLAGGQSYPQQAIVQAGNIPPGTYYVLVQADGGGAIYEGSAASTYETNNVRASGAVTLSAPAVDLSVGGVSVSTPHHSGTFRTFSWTVTNSGTSPTLATQWSDHVILSRDAVVDPTDITLGYKTRTSVLAAGAGYTAAESYFIPAGLTGDYNVFVITDKNNGVVESNNANNASAPLGINLTLPPPAELNVTNITPPPSVELGGDGTFTWTVQNTGANAVSGKWRDTVYLSRDLSWDASDTLVGVRDLDSVTTSVPAGGGTYTVNLTAPIPSIADGAYYVIVRTDSQNRVRETDEANNVTVSVGTTAVTITELSLNTPLNTTLGNGASRFFKYATAPAETLVFSLVTDTPARSNEALTNFGSPVSRADYDFQSTRPGEGDQENVVTETRDGTYYSMVRTDLIPESFSSSFKQAPATAPSERSGLRVPVTPQNISVQAKILPFSVRSVSPEEAGNSGHVSIIVDGAKFEAGATLKLVNSSGVEVIPLRTRVFPAAIGAILDLTGKPAGDYDIVVRNPNGQTAVLEDGFKVLSGGGASEPRVTISGPNASRGGRTRYTISVANDGLNDLYLVPIIVAMPSRFAYELDTSNSVGDISALMQADAVPSQLPKHYEEGGVRIIPLFTPVLGTKRTVRVNIDIMLPFGFGDFKVSAAALPPLTDWYKMSRAEQQQQLSRRAANLGNGTEEACNAQLKTCMQNFVVGLLFSLLQEFLPGECIGAVYAGITSAVGTVIGVWLNGGPGDAWNKLGTMADLFAANLGNIAVECGGQVIPWLKIVSIALTSFKGFMDWLNCVLSYYDCLPPPPEEHYTSFPMSLDPNEKVGPKGYGAEGFVPAGQPLEYRINFENLASATAPAQLVRITDSLPPPLDLRTVRLREIGFKQYRFVMPENQAYYQSRVQLGEDVGNLQADILAGVDLVNGRIFWNIQAIDPNTSQAPLDPFAGILPPNNANKDGEGYVIFTVEARSSFPNRTMIGNSATITFDQNEPIVTNTTANLLDSVVPTSQISALPATMASPSIELNWTGSDDTDGSGFTRHSILYSEDGGSYQVFANSPSDTSTIFTGRWGKSYRFYSVGRDNAGNVEAPPAVPDAVTTVLGGDTEGDVSPRPNGSDGQLTADDANQVRRFAAMLDTNYTYNEFQRADTAPKADGGSGTLSVADVVQANRYVSGLDAKAEAAGPNNSATFTPRSAEGKRANFTDPRQIIAVRAARTLNKVKVAIQLSAQGDEVGAGFTLNFDPAVLSGPVVTAGPDAASGTLTANTAQASAGKVGLMFDKAPNAPFSAGYKLLAFIEFDVIGNPPAATPVSFSSDVIASEVVSGTALSLSTLYPAATIELLTPTAAGVSVSGRVTDAGGVPVRKAVVTLVSSSGRQYAAVTNAFGLFTFPDVTAGDTYTLSVRAKKLTFASRLLNVGEDVSGLELSPEPE